LSKESVGSVDLAGHKITLVYFVGGEYVYKDNKFTEESLIFIIEYMSNE
jgi:hypothetical protein